MGRAHNAVADLICLLKDRFAEIRDSVNALQDDGDKKDIIDYFAEAVALFENFKEEMFV